jgi:hypothetical protein
MPLGPGKYDDACTAAMLATEADAVILIVVNGNKGNGFAVQAYGIDLTAKIPGLLRVLADDLEKSLSE